MEVAVFKIDDDNFDYKGRSMRIDYYWIRKEHKLTFDRFIPTREESLLGGGVVTVDEASKSIQVLIKWVDHQTNHPDQDIHDTKEGKFFLELSDQIKTYKREERLNQILNK